MEEQKGDYDGPERRSEYCPVHHIKCEEWKNTEADMRKRVPIWVFTIFVTALGSLLAYMNYDTMQKQEKTLVILNTHIERSNRILSTVSHGLLEIGMNQRKVMRGLDLEFEHVPKYGADPN